MATTNNVTLVEERLDRIDGSLDYEALIIPQPNGSFRLKHSHVAIPKKGAGAWYGDSLTQAADWDTAISLIKFQKTRLLSAFKVEEW
ncbi:hypothetical protein [Celeribacter sp.]|uniref:hypothetical protein n=1 Tax=Celeribacter sp. TaxID=1890673 RepID=UPI003A8D60F4